MVWFDCNSMIMVLDSDTVGSGFLTDWQKHWQSIAHNQGCGGDDDGGNGGDDYDGNGDDDDFNGDDDDGNDVCVVLICFKCMSCIKFKLKHLKIAGVMLTWLSWDQCSDDTGCFFTLGLP